MVPGACVPRALAFLHILGCYPVGLQCREAQPVMKQSARPTRNRPSARRAYLVRWSQFFHIPCLLILRSAPRLQQARSAQSRYPVKDQCSGPLIPAYSCLSYLSTRNFGPTASTTWTIPSDVLRPLSYMPARIDKREITSALIGRLIRCA
jgi:hypothetical protein